MTLNPRLVSELIRQRAGWTDDSQAARVLNLIPQALKQTGRLLAADPFTRPLVTTNRETTLIAIGEQGKLNLTTGYDSYQFLLEYFDKGQVYFLPKSEVAGTAATGTLTIQPDVGTQAIGYLTVTTPTGYSTGSLSITQGVRAVGTFTVASLPLNLDTMTVGTRTFTFVTGTPSADNQIGIQSTPELQAVAIARTITTFAALYPQFNTRNATYVASGNQVNVQSIYYSTAGNTFTTIGNVRVTAQQATLTGGVDGVQSGETVNVNGVTLQFSAAPTIPLDDDVAYLGEPQDSAEYNARLLVLGLNSSISPLLTVASYQQDLDSVNITYDTVGTIGNTFFLNNSSGGHITRSGANLTGGVGGIVQGQTMTIGNSGGVTFTFSNFNASDATNTYLPFSSNGDPAESADLIAEALETKTDIKVSVANYTSVPPVNPDDESPARVIKITYGITGTVGNSYGLTTMPASITRSGTTLIGGVAGTVQNNETLVINGFTVTFKSSAGAFPEVQIGATPTITASNLAAGLNSSANILLNVATYTSDEEVVTITYDSYGNLGNTYTLAYSSLFGVFPSGSTLTGGSGGVNITDNTFTVENYVGQWANLDRVRFTTTDNLPTPLTAGVDYYIANYELADDGLSATFQVASNSTGTSIVNLTDTGSGILTVNKFGGSGNPMQMITNPQLLNLPQYFQSEFQYFAIDDSYMRLIADADGVFPVGQISFAVPAYPTTVETLPNSEEAERLFLDTLMEIVAMPVIPND